VIEVQLQNPRPIAELERAGLEREVVHAAMTTMFLSGMVEIVRTGLGKLRGGGSVDPDGPMNIEYVSPRGEPIPRPARSQRADAASHDSPASSGDDRDPSGLVIVRRSSGAVERPRPDP